MNNIQIAPCYHCSDRVPLCHSACPRYAEYCEARKEVRKQAAQDAAIDEAFATRGDKIRRDAHRWAGRLRGGRK